MFAHIKMEVVELIVKPIHHQLKQGKQRHQKQRKQRQKKQVEQP
jgi:hypothetical protein